MKSPAQTQTNRVNRRIPIGALLVMAACHAGASIAASAAPDLILVHGKVLTLDAHDSIAQAIAVRTGAIVAVGTDRDILRLAGIATQIIDLHGRTATPGLIDSHAHIADGGIGELYDVQLTDAISIEEIVRRVKLGIASLKPGEWLVGEGWDEGKLTERRYVLAEDLDKVSLDNPVWLGHTSGHYGVANSYALRMAHITADTADPPAGTIDRDPKGHPTGVLKESAMNLVVNLIPPPTPEQRRAGILRSIETLHKEGITAVKDPAIDAPTWDAYRQLLSDGQLVEHVCVLWNAGVTLVSAKEALALIEAQPKPPASLGDGRLLSCGAKIFIDGSGGARTAWVYKEWNKNSTEVDTGNVGYPNMDPDVYRQQVRLFHQAGIHIGTHAIGDRAIDTVVDTYAAMLKEKPTYGLRHSIIHANIPSDHAIQVMAALERKYDAAYPETQAPFMWWIGDLYAANFGPERSLRLMPFKTYLQHGIRWGGGSDYPVTPVPARFGLWASAERETLKGTYGAHPFGTAESIDIHQALRSYTTWAARQLFLEDRIGSLQKGKEADIAIWHQDMYEMPTKELRDLHCEMTIFHGKIVYQAPEP
jgi:predicted amidohydrolase YtcJ